MIIPSNKYADLPVFITKNLFTNDINLLKKHSAVTMSVKNLILTIQGERRFNYSIGSAIYGGLFATIPNNGDSDEEVTDFINSIITTIGLFEPRVYDVVPVVSFVENEITLKLTYKIIDSSDIQTLNIAL